MPNVVIAEEPATSSAGLSLYHAAIDELIRRYGGDDGLHVDLEELSPPRGFFLVARLGGDLGGGVGVRPLAGEGRHLGEVKRLWVRPDQRRRGLARRLMAALEDHARDHGFDQLYLETGVAQPEAIAFYRSTGWTEVADFPPGSYSYPTATRFTKLL